MRDGKNECRRERWRAHSRKRQRGKGTDGESHDEGRNGGNKERTRVTIKAEDKESGDKGRDGKIKIDDKGRDKD